MWLVKIKYRESSGPLIFLVILSLNGIAYSQEASVRKPLQLINPPGSITIRNIFIPERIYGSFYNTPRPPVTDHPGIQHDLYDSLRLRASKYLLTRKLYDYVIVSKKPSTLIQLRESSETNFLPFAGKRIRKIDIVRLDVFGSDIDNPFDPQPNKLENLLNKTHLNTNEFIIRKNLLFSEGDSISPISLSENERILRELPFVSDSRIVIIPVSEKDVDIYVITKDVYSLGAAINYSSIDRGSLSVFEKNVLGIGHEFRLDLPYDQELPDSPGIGLSYNINNLLKSFIDLNTFWHDGLGEKTYGFNINRKLVSSATKYAGGISLKQIITSEDLDTMQVAESLKINFQDYWLSRSFLLDRKSVTRFIIGLRYTNNNAFSQPDILPDSYYNLQQYKIFLASLSFSRQRYYKTNLIYGYGITEDIPYGLLVDVTTGKEINEFKERIYAGVNLSSGHSVSPIGYFYSSAGISTFFNGNKTEQGLLMLRTSFFSNLNYLGTYRMRNFVNLDYTRGFGRYSDEYLFINKEHGFSGFSNDSIRGNQRLSLNIESVFFSPANFYGFRFAFFAYAGAGFLFGTNQYITEGHVVSSLGAGIRIRNDNLVFNTFQIRIGFFPNLPLNSNINYLCISGEHLLRPANFEPGPPSVMDYK